MRRVVPLVLGAEFDKAAKEVASTAPVTAPPLANAGTDALIVAANSLGIVTQGKTRDEIAREIRAVHANN